MRHSARLIEVLLVEDSETDAMMAREALKDAKVANKLYRVETGEEALEFLNKQGRYADVPTPDLILLDLNLPGISGQEVLGQIKSDRNFKLIPVVVLTTSSAEEDIVKAYGLNANSYVTKPVGFDELARVVHAIEQFWLGIVALPRVESD
jgi:CheY-like chemotaxis protein